MQSNPLHLTILHLNDLHGRLEQLPKLMTLVQREKVSVPEDGHVLFLEAGDSTERTRWESDITQGRINLKLLELIGVQATVMGNGEGMQYGPQAVRRQVEAIDIPMLGANVFTMAERSWPGIPGLKRYVWFNLDGFLIAVIGVTSPFGGGYERFDLYVAPAEKVLPDLIKEVRAKGADFVVLLSHMGYAEDEDLWEPNYKSDHQLAREIEGIDVIVGAHSHTQLDNPFEINRSIVVQAGHYGEFLGRLDLAIDRVTGRVSKYEGRLIPVDNTIPSDPSIREALSRFREEADAEGAVVIGEASTQIWHDHLRPSPMGTLVSDALRDIAGAEIGMIWSGFIAAGLPAGTVTRRRLYDALPGGTHATAAVIKGRQIWRMVEKGCDRTHIHENSEVFRGLRPLGVFQNSSNMTIDYDLTDLSRPQVTGIAVNSTPIEMKQDYHLVSTYLNLNDLGDRPDYGYVILEPGQPYWNIQVEKVLWQIMEDWVKRHSPLSAGALGSGEPVNARLD